MVGALITKFSALMSRAVETRKPPWRTALGFSVCGKGGQMLGQLSIQNDFIKQFRSPQCLLLLPLLQTHVFNVF